MVVRIQRDADARERMDGPLAPAELDATLDDLDFLNAWVGGYALTLRRLRRVAAALPHGARLRVGGVGGGGGDFSRHRGRLARLARSAVGVLGAASGARAPSACP